MTKSVQAFLAEFFKNLGDIVLLGDPSRREFRDQRNRHLQYFKSALREMEMEDLFPQFEKYVNEGVGLRIALALREQKVPHDSS